MNDGDQYKTVVGALLKECPVRVQGFAMVAVGEDGQLYWGADYPVPCDRKLRMIQFLNIIVRDVRDSLKRCRAHDHLTTRRVKK